MDARQQVIGRCRALFEDRYFMSVPCLAYPAVARPAVGMNQASWFDHVRNERQETFSPGVRDATHPNTPDSLSISLRRDHHQRFFVGLPAGDSFLQTSEISFIHLDFARQFGASGHDHSLPDFMKP